MASKEELRRVSIYINGTEAELTLKKLEQGSRKLKNELAGLVPGTEEFKKKMLELRETTGVLDDIKKDIKGVGGAFGWLKTEIGKLGALAAGYMGFEFVTEQFKNIISQNAKLADSVSNIQKTTGLSEVQVKRLQHSFKEIDTRSSRAELDSLAEVAGKLGISAEKDVLGFVRAADQINVALGEDLGNAEEAINDLGKLTEIFKVKDEFGLERALLKTGSAINDLGAAGTANEGYIVEFTKRLGGVAPAANISMQNVLGMAATFDELGQPVEAAATSIGQFVVGMGNDIPRFAKIAKMSIADFSKLLAEDGNEALIAVLKNLQSTGQGVKGLAESMGMIGEDGARATAALGLLSNNIDLLQKRQTLANDSFDKGISLTNEFNIKNNNFGALVDKLSKKLNALFTNHTMTDFLVKGTELMGGFIDAINKGSGTISIFVQLMIAGAAGYIAYNVAVKAATVSQRAWWATLLESETITKLIMVREAAWTSLKLLLTGRIKEARAAMVGFNAICEANPIGLVIGAIAALATAMYLLDDEVTEGTKVQQALNDVQKDAVNRTAEQKDKIKTLTDIINDHNESRENQITAIKRLRELMPDHLKGYTDEEILAGKAKKSIDDYIDALDRRAQAEAANDALRDLYKKRRDVEATPGEASWWQKAKVGAYRVVGGEGMAGFKEAQYKVDNKTEELSAIDAKIDAIKSNYKSELKKKALTGDGNTTGVGFDLANATKGELEDQLKKDGKALDQLKKGTKEYNIVAAEMLAIRKRLKEIAKDTGVGLGGDNKKDPAAEMLSQSKAMSEVVRNFNADKLADLQNKNDKEVADSENTYNEKINQLKAFLEKNKTNKNLSDTERKKHEAEIAQLEKAKTDQTNAIRLRQEKELTEKIQDMRKSLARTMETQREKEVARINDFYDDQLEAGGNAVEIEKARAKDLADAKLREEERFQEDVQNLKADGEVVSAKKDDVELARIHKKYDAQRKALQDKYKGELQDTAAFKEAMGIIDANEHAEVDEFEEDKSKKRRDQAVEVAQDISNAVFEISRNNRKADLDAELKKLDDKKEAELSNKNLTEDQKESINKKYAKLEADAKLRAWNADKKAALQQAVINGALGVVKAIPNLVLMGIAGVAAASQIAVIAATKPPEFFHGGYSAIDYKSPKGYVNRPTLFKNSASGRAFSAGENYKTEYIVSSEQLKDPVVADFVQAMESNRGVRRFEAGGYSNARLRPSVANPDRQQAPAAADLSPLLDSLDGIKQAIHNQEISFNYRTFDREKARIDKLKEDSRG